MAGLVKGAMAKRSRGKKPSPPHAAVAALVVGVAIAVLAYRVMRS
jgi:hypothetical protein